MSDLTFKNRKAIVTGGAQGIGQAVAERLAAGGAQLALWDVDEALAKETASKIGNGSFSVSVDISDWESVKQSYAETLQRIGRVDIVINSAGIAGSNATVADYAVEEFRKIVDINLN